MDDRSDAIPGVSRPFNSFELFQADVADLEFRRHRAALSGDPSYLSHYWELQAMWGRAPESAGDLTGCYGSTERANHLFGEICERANLKRRLTPTPPPNPPSWLSAENWTRRIERLPQDLTLDDDNEEQDMAPVVETANDGPEPPEEEESASTHRRHHHHAEGRDEDEATTTTTRDDRQTLTDYLTKKRRLVIEYDSYNNPTCLHARTLQHLHGVEQNRSYTVTVVKNSGDPRACHTRLYDSKKAGMYAYQRMHNLGYVCTFGVVLLPDDISGWGDSDEGRHERALDDVEFAKLWRCGPNGLFSVQRYRTASASAASTDPRG